VELNSCDLTLPHATRTETEQVFNCDEVSSLPVFHQG